MRQAILESLATALTTFSIAAIVLAAVPGEQQQQRSDLPCIYCTETGCSQQNPPCQPYTGCRAIGDSTCYDCFCKLVQSSCLCQ